MICNFIHEDERNWARCLDPLLFTVQEVPQPVTGFSPFELLFSRKPQEVLDLIKENREEGPSPAKNEIQYVLDQRAKLQILWGEICFRPKNISSACTTEGLDFQAIFIHTVCTNLTHFCLDGLESLPPSRTF